MARVKDQDARRSEILDAAVRAVRRHGAVNVSLRKVATEAGLSSALILYYYKNADELLQSTFQHGTIEFCEHREIVVARETNPVRRLEVCISWGVPYVGARADAARILYELQPLVLQNPDAAVWHREFFERQAALYAQIVREGIETGDFKPSESPEVIAESLVALEDGYGVHALTGTMKPETIERRLLDRAREFTRCEALGPA